MLIKKNRELIEGQYIEIKRRVYGEENKNIGLRVIGVYPHYALFKDEYGIKHVIQNTDLINMGVYKRSDCFKGQYGTMI